MVDTFIKRKHGSEETDYLGDKDIEKVSKMVSDNMKSAVKLDVPLYVNTKLNNSLANFNN